MTDQKLRATLLSLAQELEAASAMCGEDMSDLVDEARECVLKAANMLVEQERDIDAEIKDDDL